MFEAWQTGAEFPVIAEVIGISLTVTEKLHELLFPDSSVTAYSTFERPVLKKVPLASPVPDTIVTPVILN